MVPSEENPQQFGSTGIGLRKFVPIELDEDGLPTVSQGPPNALVIGSADDAQSLGTASPLDPLFMPTGEFVVGANPFGEVLTGTALEDVILGGFGADRIDGDDEDDIVIADLFGAGLGGGDTIDGGEGDDIVFGNAGSDEILGGIGEDLLIGGFGRDKIFGGDGIDLIVGDLATDIPIPNFAPPNLGMDGPPGTGPSMLTADGMLASDGMMAADLVSGTPFESLLPGGDLPGDLDGLALLQRSSIIRRRLDDTIDAGDGNDVVFGGDGRDLVLGKGGKDYLFGGADRDRIFGGWDDDILDGGEGNDVVYGQGGDDVIVTGLGDDHLIGNRGSDRFLVFGEEGAPVIDTGNDVIWGFWKGKDVIDLSAFYQPPNPFAMPEAPDFDALADAAFSAGPRGWLEIDVSALGGNVEGAGTILVRGLAFEDVEASDFLFDTVLTPEFDPSGFF